MNNSFPVRVLCKAKEAISENGYLVNIRKRSIIVDGKSFKVKYGEGFEVAKELVFLKKWLNLSRAMLFYLCVFIDKFILIKKNYVEDTNLS